MSKDLYNPKENKNRMKYTIYTTEEFDKELNKLDKSEQIRVNKILKQLKEKGGNVGKSLSGLSFFKEKKFGNKRLYFLIYENFLVILVISISDKKAQQATINRILLDIKEYQQYILEIVKKSKN